MSEFGACISGEACFHEIRTFAEAADNYLVGWAYW